ncbi:MAG: class I SAM-dependent methyltransferase [Acidimicrobiales bacterium]
MSWEMVDEGWGRKAVDFATIAEPANMREYSFMFNHLGVGPEHRLLDVACGAGLALELARQRGATTAGIDASPRLIAVARNRSPEADIQVGDMHALPWADDSFDVVTSFRGVWGTTPDAMHEIRRVLRPGGRFAMTVWGNVKRSPGAWMFEPFLWSTEEGVAHQAEMVSLGKPGVGEAFLAEYGFEPDERVAVPFVLEYADPEMFARGTASVGPAFEAIQQIGEDEFRSRAVALASDRVREGLPLRGEIELFGYVGTG